MHPKVSVGLVRWEEGDGLTINGYVHQAPSDYIAVVGPVFAICLSVVVQRTGNGALAVVDTHARPSKEGGELSALVI